MKIGDFARQFNISTHAVRYYINFGLLVPTSRNNQFVFDAEDINDMEEIIKLKQFHFSIKEIHNILSLKRFSNFSNTNDANDYINLLISKKAELFSEQHAINKSIEGINKEIDNVSKKITKHTIKTGLPLSVMQFLYCPYCQKPLNFNDVVIENQQILEGNLNCACGYSADIREGILYTKDSQVSPYDYPDLERKCYKDLTPTTISLLQKSYKWILSQLGRIDLKNKLILESHLNAFCFLYTHFEILDKDAIYILVDSFPEIISMYKEKIDSLGLDLNVLYIVNCSSKYPLKHGCLDVHLDYFSTNEYSLFHEDSNLTTEIIPYFGENSHFIGTFFFLKKNSQSFFELKKQFPQVPNDSYLQPVFKKDMQELPIVLADEEFNGFAIDAGNNQPFPLRCKGEKLGLYSFNYTKI